MGLYFSFILSAFVSAIFVFANGTSQITKTEIVLLGRPNSHSLPGYFLEDPGKTGPIAANAQSEILLLRTRETRPGIEEEQAVLWNQITKEVFPLPLLKGYSAIEPNDINEKSEVVGYVSKAQYPYNRAFVWNSKTGISGLSHLPQHVASLAFANSEDRIVGSSIGNGEFSAVVWERPSQNQNWNIQRLPSSNQNGLPARALAISPNGKLIVGEDAKEAVLWREKNGAWEKLALLPQKGGIARAVNNAGMVAGEMGVVVRNEIVIRPFVWSEEKGLQTLECLDPKEDRGVHVASISATGIVAGHCSKEVGREPRGFLWTADSGFWEVNVKGHLYSQVFEMHGDLVLGQIVTSTADDNHFFGFRLGKLFKKTS